MEDIQEITNNLSRALIHANGRVSEKIADNVVSAMGSWRFILVQTVVVISWVTLNFIALFRHWDPYPFILLNLIFSTQAAYSSPLILMAANGQRRRDRKRDDLEGKRDNIEAEQVKDLLEIHHAQLYILKELDDLQKLQMSVLNEIREKTNT